MQALRLHAPGDLASLRVDTIDPPPLADGEVLVRVHAAGLTRGELAWSANRLPAIPSHELSGVVAFSAGLAGIRAGDPVIAFTGFDRGGAAAEYAAVPENRLVPKPDALRHADAAALPLAALTAWQGLFDHGRLQRGERVLILGAGGGVGHLALQLARWHGGHVIACASSASLAAVHGSQAHAVVDSSVIDFAEVLEPVDLVFDTAGGERLHRAERILRSGGRAVSLSAEAGATTFVTAPNRVQLFEIARLAAERVLRPYVSQAFRLADSPLAFERLMGTRTAGKVVLSIQSRRNV